MVLHFEKNELNEKPRRLVVNGGMKNQEGFIEVNYKLRTLKNLLGLDPPD
jgi:hypothetical protein